MNDYDIKTAGQRLLFRFKPNEKGFCKTFTPNDEDIKALSVLLKWITRQKEDVVNNNLLFSKLFIKTLLSNIRTTEACVLDEMIHKELLRDLNKPIEFYIEGFVNEIRVNQASKVCFLAKDKNKTQEQLTEMFNRVYSPEFIESKLRDYVSEALNRFSKKI